MSQPGVTQTETDGALGVLPEGAGVAFAIVGTSSLGTVDQPAAYSKVSDVVAAFGVGPLVEAAAYYIDNYQRPVLLVKTGGTTAGAYVGAGTFTYLGGTSVFSRTAATIPLDDYEPYVIFDIGGTRGTAGIFYRTSLDGGRTLSASTALGTATSISLGNGVSYDLAAGTIIAGATIVDRTSAPAANSTELGTAIDAAKASAIPWELMLVTGFLDGTLYDVVNTKIADKHHAWIGTARTPSIGESEATYLAALVTIFSAKSSVYGELCAGACDLTSGVNSRKYRRPVSFAIGALEAASSEEVNIADPNLPSLPGVSIHDSLGILKHHDESNNPGLDDARFSVLRTWVDFNGIFPNRPRLFCSPGSDFYIMPMRRLLNIIHRTAKRYMVRRLNQPTEVNKKTGYVKEQELSEMESGCDAAFSAALAGKKTSARLALSRTDKVLNTRKLTGKYRGLPPAYIELAELDGGFENPANNLV
jgi:hypothetical protein